MVHGFVRGDYGRSTKASCSLSARRGCEGREGWCLYGQGWDVGRDQGQREIWCDCAARHGPGLGADMSCGNAEGGGLGDKPRMAGGRGRLRHDGVSSADWRCTRRAMADMRVYPAVGRRLMGGRDVLRRGDAVCFDRVASPRARDARIVARAVSTQRNGSALVPGQSACVRLAQERIAASHGSPHHDCRQHPGCTLRREPRQTVLSESSVGPRTATRTPHDARIRVKVSPRRRAPPLPCEPRRTCNIHRVRVLLLPYAS